MRLITFLVKTLRSFLTEPNKLECYFNHKDHHISVYRNGFYCVKCNHHIDELEVYTFLIAFSKSIDINCFKNHDIKKIGDYLMCLDCKKTINPLDYMKWKRKNKHV